MTTQIDTVTDRATGSGAKVPVADGDLGTGSRRTQVLGFVCLAAVALWGFLGLVASPPDEVQGEAVRLMYVHVPVVTVAYLASFIGALASGVWLWRKTQWWDLVAAAAVELAAVFTAATLVTGAIWGGAAWGTYWVWDARLTSTALLFLLQLGYLAVRRIPATSEVRGKRSAILGLLLVPNIIIVNQSVTWWRSIHQDATVFKLSPPNIHGVQYFAFFWSLITGALILLWLMVHRFRVGYLQDQVDEHGLDLAIAERRAEGETR